MTITEIIVLSVSTGLFYFASIFFFYNMGFGNGKTEGFQKGYENSYKSDNYARHIE